MFDEYTYTPSELDLEIAELKRKYYELTEKPLLEKLREQQEHLYSKENRNPKIFIYTPTYNRGDILKERALKSVLSQTYKNFEYLVVGDCCTDETERIISEINDSRVRFFNIGQRNWRYPPKAQNHWLAGPIVAANTALSMVHGDWIARIDDDDMWVEDHLEKCVQMALDGNWEFLSGLHLTVRDGVESVPEATPMYSDYFRLELPKGMKEEENPLIGGTSSIFYRAYLNTFQYNTDCWRKPHNKNNDLDLYLRMGLAGVRMGFTDRVEFLCLPRPGETTIGSDAYRRNAENVNEQYAFNEEKDK